MSLNWSDIQDANFDLKIDDILNGIEYEKCSQIQQMLYHVIKNLQRPYIYEMRGFNGFVDNAFGLVVAHSDVDAKVVWRITPNWTGNYKFLIAYASDSVGNSVSINYRIGSWRFGELFDANRYIPVSVATLQCSTAFVPLQAMTATFTIENLNEVLIIELQKTSNSGTGNFYVLGGAFIKQ